MDIELELTPCPVCDEPNGPTDYLGTTAHYCCRACGIWYTTTIEVDTRDNPFTEQGQQAYNDYVRRSTP